MFNSKEIILHSNKILETPLFKSSFQLKMFSKILTAVRKNKNTDIYSFEIKDILKEFDYTKNSYYFLKQESEKMQRPINFGDKNKKGFINRVLFTDVDTQTSPNLITFKINLGLKELIIDLSQGYTSYYIENILRLEASYSIRIYQLLKQYESLGSRIITIDDLKHYLSIEQKKYSLYGHFKDKVILPTQKEIKLKTDIFFTFEEIKTGRKITSIKFIISKNQKIITAKKENNELEKNKIDLESGQAELYEKLIKLGISKPATLETLKHFDSKRIENNIRYIERKINRGEKIVNTGGLLKSAIQGDYYNQTDLFNDDQNEIKRRKQREEQEQEMIKREFESKQNTLSKNFFRQERDILLQPLNDDEKESLLEKLKQNFSGFMFNQIKDLENPFLIPHIIELIENYKEREKEYIKLNMEYGII